jgi:hypothetical protein
MLSVFEVRNVPEALRAVFAFNKQIFESDIAVLRETNCGKNEQEQNVKIFFHIREIKF